MRGWWRKSVESRSRLISFKNEESSKTRFVRRRVVFNLRKLTKPVIALITIAAFVSFLRSPPHLQDTHFLPSQSRPNSLEEGMIDERYTSHLNIDWNQVSKLMTKEEYTGLGVGFLNFDDKEIDGWKQFLPYSQHVVLLTDYVSPNLTWKALYPEWIDEEEEYGIPSCPDFPEIQFSGKPRLRLIAVKLPCNKSSNWGRDVARFHLQLAAARLAATVKGYHPLHILFITDCWPTPNLFTCKDLIAREGNAWMYNPNLNELRAKLNLPVGSCELALPMKIEENRGWNGNPKREAYATIIMHKPEKYICGAIAAAQSIRIAGSTRDLVILVDEGISDRHRTGLEEAGWKIHKIKRIRNPRAMRGAYNEWNYSKLRVWQLTQYDKIVFIDSDLLVLRNIDFLFQMPEITAAGNSGTLFNSGVMVIEPSDCTFDLLMEHVKDIVSYNGGDQGYLNEIFTWWHRIPKHMNYLKYFWNGEGAASIETKTRLFGADPAEIYVLHYLGQKPWWCFRDYDCNWNRDLYRRYASDVAHATWWRIHDLMPENLHRHCLLDAAAKMALEMHRKAAEKSNFSDGHWRITIQDPRLRM